MGWEELIELFADERVDSILGKGRAGRYSRWERKLFAMMGEEAREKFEIAAVEEAEEAAGECREVYCRAFLDGLYMGFLVWKGHGKEPMEKNHKEKEEA